MYAVAPDSTVDPGKLALNGTQRDDCFVALNKVVSAAPFRTTATSIVQTLTVSVELRAAGSADAPFLELDATKLSKQFAKHFNGQVVHRIGWLSAFVSAQMGSLVFCHIFSRTYGYTL